MNDIIARKIDLDKGRGRRSRDEVRVANEYLGYDYEEY